MVGEIGDALRALAALCAPRPQAWWADAGRRDTPAPGSAAAALNDLQGYASEESLPMKPQRVIWDMRQTLADDDILISDVGAHKVWLALYYPSSRPNTTVIANGFASMGIAVPGGLAAKWPSRSAKSWQSAAMGAS